MSGNSATIYSSPNRNSVISQNLTYKDAGVDIDAGAVLVERIGAACKATHRPEMLSNLGGFAAMTEIPAGYDQPVLVSGTDGVGTKLKLAIDHDRHDGVGQDLVAMCVNDVLVTGAEPFLFLDYYATGRLDVDTAARVIKGIALGCELAGCSLAGGETAEMPGFYDGDEYDLAGFAVGVVNKPNIIDGSQIRKGDTIIGLPSSGPHSNGYSLVRKVLENQARQADESLLDALLAPTRIYVRSVLQTLRDQPGAIHGMVHITGGGFYENIPRIFSDDSLAALIDTDSWTWPGVFGFIQQAGNIEHREMLTTFNCGVGFLMMADPTHTEAVLEALVRAGEKPMIIGQVVDATTNSSASQILVS